MDFVSFCCFLQAQTIIIRSDAFTTYHVFPMQLYIYITAHALCFLFDLVSSQHIPSTISMPSYFQVQYGLSRSPVKPLIFQHRMLHRVYARSRIQREI